MFSEDLWDFIPSAPFQNEITFYKHRVSQTMHHEPQVLGTPTDSIKQEFGIGRTWDTAQHKLSYNKSEPTVIQTGLLDLKNSDKANMWRKLLRRMSKAQALILSITSVFHATEMWQWRWLIYYNYSNYIFYFIILSFLLRYSKISTCCSLTRDSW